MREVCFCEEVHLIFFVCLLRAGFSRGRRPAVGLRMARSLCVACADRYRMCVDSILYISIIYINNV